MSEEKEKENEIDGREMEKCHIQLKKNSHLQCQIMRKIAYIEISPATKAKVMIARIY